ncbi:MAG: CPBP family intramembrane metalloprotease [Saprospiraceae bacterium]|nr:CPBP family intramembrane metalloprotease [Saprospiraceae bacterium]MBP9194455.1 CPBP family intramembrane metalloprotease [Saprospiraceae bacterium]
MHFNLGFTTLRSRYVLAVLIFFLCLILGSGAMHAFFYFNGLNIKDSNSLYELLENKEHIDLVRASFGISHLIGFVLSSYIIGKILKRGPFETASFPASKFDPKVLMKWFLLLLLCYPLAGLLGFWAGKIPLPEWMSAMDESSFQALEGLIKMDSPIQLMANLLIIAIIPGIGEEMLFRGILQAQLQLQVKKMIYVVFLSAFIFAAFHLQFVGFFPKMVIGLVLAATYFYTGNLWYTIGIHILNNSFHVILAYARPESIESQSTEVNFEANQQLIVLLTLPLIYWYFNHLKKEKLNGGST